MTDHLTENARLRAALEFYANPAAWNQPPFRTREGLVSVEYENEASKMQRDRGKIARAALATPAPDAVMEAARVPEIAALIEAADNLMLNYLQDELEEPDLCVDDEHWAAIHDLNAAIRAIAGDRT